MVTDGKGDEMTTIIFTVPGEPKPQGSKDQFGRESCKALPAWRSLVSMAAKSALDSIGGIVSKRPISVFVTFEFSRPRSHYGTGKNSGKVKQDAPIDKISKPDIDKLCRAIMDAMTGIVFQDDSQVVEIRACKIYGPVPGAYIRVKEHLV